MNRNHKPGILKYYLIILIINVGHSLSIIFDLNCFMLILGLLVIGYIPGSLSIRLLFRRTNTLSKYERWLLSICLSLLIITALSLLLNLISQGLSPNIVFTSVWILIGILLIINLIFDQYWPLPAVPPPLYEGFHFRWSSFNSINYKSLSHISILIVALLSLALLIHLTLSAKVDERYTEFFVLDDSGKADPSSLLLYVGNPKMFIFGISNHQGDDQQYYFEATSADNLLYRSDPFLVNDGDTNYIPVTLQLHSVSSSKRVEIRLLITGQVDPLSTLLLQVVR